MTDDDITPDDLTIDDEKIEIEDEDITMDDVAVTIDDSVDTDDLISSGNPEGELTGVPSSDVSEAQRLDIRDPSIGYTEPTPYSSFSEREESPVIPETIETFDFDVDEKMGEKLFNRVMNAIDEKVREYGHGDPQVLVLGLPQYRVLYPYIRAEFDAEPVDVYGDVDQVVVVPGPIIHVALDNRRMLLGDIMAEDE